MDHLHLIAAERYYCGNDKNDNDNDAVATHTHIQKHFQWRKREIPFQHTNSITADALIQIKRNESEHKRILP